MHGVEASLDALALARANGQHLQLSVRWLAGDWWAPLAGATVDLALSNPPYIAGDDPHLHALRHEPRQALTPGGDGLAALQAIIAEARAHLRAGAWLLVEHGPDQGAAVRSLLARAGLECVLTRRDLAGLERCSGARRPPSGR